MTEKHVDFRSRLARITAREDARVPLPSNHGFQTGIALHSLPPIPPKRMSAVHWTLVMAGTCATLAMLGWFISTNSFGSNLRSDAEQISLLN